MKRSGRILMLLVCGSLVLGCLQGGCASEVARGETQPPAPAAQPSTQELDQLVAPIALYPDALIAQILAGATYPTEIVEPMQSAGAVSKPPSELGQIREFAIASSFAAEGV
jgi:hypothetical protein